MFFKKKKPKIDPKVRFQNRQFNQKLHQARTFKRTVRAIPEGSFSKFLLRVGLGSTWKQILALIVFGGIVYLIYIPNFLTTQKFIIVGMSAADTEATQNVIENTIKKAPIYNPQRNMLFLSKNRIKAAAITVAGVDHVNDINKDFKTKTVTISITSKYERFLVRSSEKVYDVYNDGSTKGVAGVDRNYWEGLHNPGMIKVEVAGKIINQDNKEFLNANTVKYISEVEKQLKGVVGSSLAFVKITLPEFRQPASPVEEPKEQENQPEKAETNDEKTDETAGSETTEPETAIEEPAPAPESNNLTEVTLPLKADELELFMQKGDNQKSIFRVMVDTKESPHDLVQRLNLLLSQTAPERYNNLSYIDLRVQNRAFVCLLGTICSK